MVASHKPIGRKESLIQIVARRLSSKQRPGPARLGEEEAGEVAETSEVGAGEASERKQSLVDMLAARFSRTPRQLKVGGIEGEMSDESVEGTPETERRESLVKKISRRFSRTPKLQLKLGEDDLDFIMQHTGLQKEAVELHFKQFQRSHPGGVMDPAGLRAMLQVSLLVHFTRTDTQSFKNVLIGARSCASIRAKHLKSQMLIYVFETHSIFVYVTLKG